MGSEELGSGELGSRGLGLGGVGGYGVGKYVVLASNSPRIKSSWRQIVTYSWAFGASGHFGQMGRVWDKWACGDWDKGAFKKMGTLGSMRIGVSGYWENIWALGENEHQEKLVPGQTGKLFAVKEQEVAANGRGGGGGG